MVLKTVNLMDSVFDLSNMIMKDPQFVSFNPSQTTLVAQEIKEAWAIRSAEYWMGYPIWFEEVRGKSELNYMLLSYELMAGAVNYQYWCGKSDVRLNDAGATLMYHILDECFEAAGSMHVVGHRTVCEEAAKSFIKQIILYRLPDAESRIRHVKEVLDTMKDGPNVISNMVKDIHAGKLRLEEFIERVVTTYPGYAGDMFLKRPFLLAMMLYRRVQWFKRDINLLPIPADYQIPKMLKWMGCIEYSKELSDMIDTNTLIPKGSLMECEIRAASILACNAIADEVDIIMCDVDTYLWLNRKKCTDPFHLTITTDY